MEEKGRLKPGFKIRLTLTANEKFFGPGIAMLLHLVDEYGSIRSAAMAMDMSYSKAWKILRRADKELGFPLLESRNGGDGGGKSALTAEGRAFLEKFDTVEKKLYEAAQGLIDEYF